MTLLFSNSTYVIVKRKKGKNKFFQNLHFIYEFFQLNISFQKKTLFIRYYFAEEKRREK